MSLFERIPLEAAVYISANVLKNIKKSPDHPLITVKVYIPNYFLYRAQLRQAKIAG